MVQPIPNLLTPHYPELTLDDPEWAQELIRQLYNKDRYLENVVRPHTAFTVLTADTTTFSGTTPITISFQTTLVDSGSRWDGTDSYYTPITGIYGFEVELTITGANTNNKAWKLTLVTSGDAGNFEDIFDTPNAAIPLSIEVNFPLITMEAGDTAHITLEGVTGGGSITLTGVANDNWFSGQKVE